MTAMPKLAPFRMTRDEFLAWPGDGSRRRFELVDGEPRAMAPASLTHGRILANLARLLGNHLLGTPCGVVIEPGVVPRLNAEFNLRIPDLAVTCSADDPGARTMEDPLILIEVLSPSNEAQTRENLWAYTTIPGLREVLLVRSTAIVAELYRRQADGNWPELPERLEAEGALKLDAIAFSAPLINLYEDTHLAAGRR